MNDFVPIIDPAIVWAQIGIREQARAALARDALAANKASVFGILVTNGITRVDVAFDGAGDSGQIESIIARTTDVPTDIPVAEITLAVPRPDGSVLDHVTLSLADAIETLAYDLLATTHRGWEINEGAFGEFVFDVDDHSIRLDYNQRIESSDYSSHSW